MVFYFTSGQNAWLKLLKVIVSCIFLQKIVTGKE